MAMLDDTIPSLTPRSIPQRELVRTQALVQARNTMRGAWLLLLDGFEVQALGLARLVTEYLVLTWYARSGADVSPWLDPTRPPPSTGDQLRALEGRAAALPELAPLIARTRALLHRLSHQDPMAFAFAYRLEDDRPSFFRPAGALDALSLRRGAEFLLPLTVLALQTAAAVVTVERARYEHEVDDWWGAEDRDSRQQAPDS